MILVHVIFRVKQKESSFDETQKIIDVNYLFYQVLLLLHVILTCFVVISSQVYKYYNFGPLTAYLALNYLDRFLSQYELPVIILRPYL